MTDDDLVARLREAQEEVARIERDPKSFPTDAPRLDDWSFRRRGASLCLTGRVTGHSRLGDSRMIMTSEIVAIGERLDWARTLNTLYLLGARMRTPTD